MLVLYLNIFERHMFWMCLSLKWVLDIIHGCFFKWIWFARRATDFLIESTAHSVQMCKLVSAGFLKIFFLVDSLAFGMSLINKMNRKGRKILLRGTLVSICLLYRHVLFSKFWINFFHLPRTLYLNVQTSVSGIFRIIFSRGLVGSQYTHVIDETKKYAVFCSQILNEVVIKASLLDA